MNREDLDLPNESKQTDYPYHRGLLVESLPLHFCVNGELYYGYYSGIAGESIGFECGVFYLRERLDPTDKLKEDGFEIAYAFDTKMYGIRAEKVSSWCYDGEQIIHFTNKDRFKAAIGHKCTCDFQKIIMVTGCICGGV